MLLVFYAHLVNAVLLMITFAWAIKMPALSQAQTPL